MNVLVTGANGYVGTHLIDRLVQEEGVEVRALVRCPLPNAPSNVHVCCIADIGDTRSIESFLDNVDVVVHTAAVVHQRVGEGTESATEYRRVNTFSTLDLARIAAHKKVKRFVYISTIGVTGRFSFETVSEDTPPAPDTLYAQSKYEAEQGLLDIAGETGMQIVVLRPPMVYGPSCPGNIERLVGLVRRLPLLPFGSLTVRRSMISINNLVSAICLLLQHPVAMNKTYVVADDDALFVRDLVRCIRDSLNVRSVLIPTPICVLETLLKLIGKSSEIESLTRPLVVDALKIREELGWRPVEATRQALQDAFGNA